MKRICIYPKDVQWITGRSDRQSRAIIQAIKIKYNKKRHQLVTVDEFCNYMGLNSDEVKKMIK